MTNQNSAGSQPAGCNTIRSTDTVLAKKTFVRNRGEGIVQSCQLR